MRVRGERIPPHYPRATTAANTLLGHQYHHRRHNYLLQSQQQHQHPDHRIFPVITENGTDSPRQRSLVSANTPRDYLSLPIALLIPRVVPEVPGKNCALRRAPPPCRLSGEQRGVGESSRRDRSIAVRFPSLIAHQDTGRRSRDGDRLKKSVSKMLAISNLPWEPRSISCALCLATILA